MIGLQIFENLNVMVSPPFILLACFVHARQERPGHRVPQASLKLWADSLPPERKTPIIMPQPVEAGGAEGGAAGEGGHQEA
eukprot:scaffold319654_cov13-Prasinocladus_malaysianus.AAC.1